MRNVAKTTTLENKFPLLAVENNCILSKDADITACFEVRLPELFTVASAEYEAIHPPGTRRLKPCLILRSFTNRIGTSKKAMRPIWHRKTRVFYQSLINAISTSDRS
jgi:hypothetical protein